MRPQRHAIFEALEGRRLLSSYVVNTTADAGPGSLRQAILDANDNAGPDQIQFSIGSGVQTIVPASGLPEITGPVTLDGTTQPGYAGAPLIEISGASAGAGVDGLVMTGGDSTVRGLCVNRFGGSGVIAKWGGNNVFEANYIGTDPTGLQPRGNGIHGLLIMGDNNRVGGTAPAQRNVISGNGVIGLFLLLANANTVQGNYIGVGADGQTAIPNRTGMDSQDGGGNLIGGTAAGAGNVLSGNLENGLLVFHGSDYNTIQGNLIGTDAAGTRAVANGGWGIELQGAYCLVGGTAPGARNILSGNVASGIVFYLGTAHHNLLQGNFIGTDITGTRAIGNVNQGVSFSGDTDVDLTAPGPHDNVIGGTTPAERNIISGNGCGVGIFNRTRNNVVSGNYFGTDVTGTVAIPNETGINIFNDSDHNTIGGTAPGAGNVIAASTLDAINIGSDYTTVQGNLIGLAPDGVTPMGSGSDAILTIFSSHSTIGGPTPAARNVIAATVKTAVKFAGGGSNVVQGNWIGTDANGATSAALGSGLAGIWSDGSSGNQLLGNVITGTAGRGVNIETGTANRISANSIYGNGLLGIDLRMDGVTYNTPGGPHTGPNNLQNFPVLSLATTDGATATVQGTLNSAPNATFTIELFSSPAAHPTGYGEGQTYLGAQAVTTDGAGNASFTVALPGALTVGHVVTATATAADGSTSEFSPARTVEAVAAAPAVTAASFEYQTRPHRILVTFTMDVSASLDPADLAVKVLPAGPEYAPAAVTWNAGTRTATFTLPDLPDGNYRATLKAAGVTNAGGVPMAADYVLDFFEMLGDANRDRAIGFADLLAVSQNYDRTGMTWGDGDFDGDGSVRFGDLLIVAKKYDMTLPAPAPTPVAALAAPVDESIVAAESDSSAAPLLRVAPEARAPARTPVRRTPVKRVAPARRLG